MGGRLPVPVGVGIVVGDIDIDGMTDVERICVPLGESVALCAHETDYMRDWDLLIGVNADAVVLAGELFDGVAEPLGKQDRVRVPKHVRAGGCMCVPDRKSVPSGLPKLISPCQSAEPRGGVRYGEAPVRRPRRHPRPPARQPH